MRLLGLYLPSAPWILVYMLQQVEYDSRQFLRWAYAFPALHKVMKRQRLVLTMRSKLLAVISFTVWFAALLTVLLALISNNYSLIVPGILLPLLIPAITGLLNALLGAVIVRPVETRQIKKAAAKLEAIQATKIAVLGSYGKTTMKELLRTVLSEGLTVAATPGNKNVEISHARWVLGEVTGNEDVLIFEYGEYRPGDIAKLSRLSRPEWGVITGLAPAHLQNYGSLDAIADDFRAIFVDRDANKIVLNADSTELTARINEGAHYNARQALDWRISSVETSLDGLSFTMHKDKHTLDIKSGLIGEHLVGPLAAAVAIGDKLGLTTKQLQAGAAKTKPFEHRMQPYKLGHATIIDDTYNGNLDGMKAGLRLLAKVPAKRRIYVTPGLVEQGGLTEKVHRELGRVIASAKPDKVVLMKNSVTDFITTGMRQAGYKGELQLEDHPLQFYTNLEHFVAAGDVVMLQNDWPDSYR